MNQEIFHVRHAISRDSAELIAIANNHPRPRLAPQTALRLVKSITANVEDLIEVWRGDQLVGAASVVVANTTDNPRAELDLFAWHPNVGRPRNELVAALIKLAEPRARSLGGASLDIGAEGLLADASPALAALGYAHAYSMYTMTRLRDAQIDSQPVEPPLHAYWRLLDADEAADYRALAAAAFAGIDGVVVPPLADFAVSVRANPPWVLVHEQKLIGFLRLAMFVENGKRIGEISTIGRDPARKAQGLGDVLMHKALTEMRAHGAEIFCLDVAAKNARALELYERFGFRTEREIKYWRRPLSPGDGAK